MSRYQQLTLESQERSAWNCGNCVNCVILPTLDSKKLAGYGAGSLFAISWWVWIDTLIMSSSVTFLHWIPGLLSTLGLILVNCIDRESLNDDSTSSLHTARLVAFLGVTLSIGSLGGSLTMLSLNLMKSGSEIYIGQMMSIQSALILVSSIVFWFGRNTESRIHL